MYKVFIIVYYFIVLITGGAGFIGYHTAVQLVSDNTVVVLDNFDNSYDVKLKWERTEKLKAEGTHICLYLTNNYTNYNAQ